MIVNTGMRTDIPAFFSAWFLNRIREGYVLVRNPYNPAQVTKYLLTPDKVDILAFCTKNPAPMLPYMDELKAFRQFWFVTITPYGKDIEPYVPDKHEVLDSFKRLSQIVGKRAVSWRYDPIFISQKYSLDYHKRVFEKMVAELCGYTEQVVISFIDLYSKTRRNFPQAREVTPEERVEIGRYFAEIGRRYGITVRSCAEGTELAQYGVDVSGCMTKEVLENAAGIRLNPPKKPNARQECSCLLGNDIGAYNTCPHACRYCYANYDRQAVTENLRRHDPRSPLLIGELQEGDTVRPADQYSYIDNQLMLDL